jgi:hypothetical protein
MTAFHDRLAGLQRILWASGHRPSPELEDMIARLSEAPLPRGVVRLPTACMAPGPHLEPQREPRCGAADYPNVVAVL